MMKNRYMGFALLLSCLMFVFCGKTSVSIDKSTYEPKIVIEGFLYPEMPISNIKLSRNFPVGTAVDKDKVALKDAQAVIRDMNAEIDYELVFNSDSSWFETADKNIRVMYGNTYRLTVSAVIDGEELTATSTTTVPDSGMQVLPDFSLVGDLYYRERDENGQIIEPFVAYQKSENSAFYLLSVTALDAAEDTFIEENILGISLKDLQEEGDSVEDFQYNSEWTSPNSFSGDYASLNVRWFYVWFYGTYRLTVYAGDLNFYHYFVTHDDVQEIDGNLKEPVFEIDGDGIGVFGSAVADTISMTILRPER